MNKVLHIIRQYWIIRFFVFILVLMTLQAQAQQRVSLMNNPEVTPEIIEKSPAISWDGKMMVFISNKGEKWGVYAVQRAEKDTWGEAKAIPAFQNYSKSNGSIHSLCLNYDGSRMYFGANFENDGGGMNIYYIDRIDDTWGQPIKLDKPVNSDGYDGSPSITPDEQTLYFVRANPNADNKDYACKAIYVSYKNKRGRWSEPSLLPQPINLACEECPTVSADGKTLYFSSIRDYKDNDGREAKDGYDLYFAKRIGERSWVNPMILDTLNTDEDELYPSISAFGETLYYSSGDEKKKNEKKRFGSVYMAKLSSTARPLKNVVLRGKVTDLATKKAVAATLRVRNPYTAELIANFKNDPISGQFQFFLPSGNNYQVDVFQSGYSHQFFQYDLRTLNENKVIQQDAEIYKNVTLILNVFDNELYESLNSSVQILDQETGKMVANAKISTLAKGRHQLTLPIGKKYLFKVAAPHYAPIEYAFNMREVVQFSEYEKDLELAIQKKQVTIIAIDAETKAGLEVAIDATNLNRRESLTISNTDKLGHYRISFREGDEYLLKFNPRGYSFKEMTLAIDASTKNQINVPLQPIKEEKTIVLNNITFELNSADLEPASFEELDRVVKFMQENEEVSIELSAHTDDLGQQAYNLLLSEKRAESVRDYLVTKGIPLARLSTKGYGKSQPLVPNTSKENRAKNRRVEMKIVKVEK